MTKYDTKLQRAKKRKKGIINRGEKIVRNKGCKKTTKEGNKQKIKVLSAIRIYCHRGFLT